METSNSKLICQLLEVDAHTLHVTNTEFPSMNICETVTQDAKAPPPPFKSEQADKTFILVHN